MLPAHAPQDRSYRFDGGDEAARACPAGEEIPARSPCLPTRTKCGGARDAGNDRAAATGPLTEWQQKLDGALRRLQGECGSRHAPFLFRLVNPGLPANHSWLAWQIEQKVRAKNTGLRRNLSRSASMPVGIACPVPGHLIMTKPILLLRSWIFCAGGKLPRHRLECAPSYGGRLFQPIPAGCKRFD